MAERREEARAGPAGAREELAKLIAEARRLEVLATVLRDLATRTEAWLAELRTAGSTLEGLAGREGAEMLVPIGAGSYIWARVGRVDKVVVGVGADVAVEMDVEKAKEVIGDRIAEAEKALNDYLRRLTEVERALAAYTERIRTLMGAARVAGGPEAGPEKSA